MFFVMVIYIYMASKYDDDYPEQKPQQPKLNDYIEAKILNVGDIIYLDQKTSIHRRVGVVKDYLSIAELKKRLIHHISIHIKRL